MKRNIAFLGLIVLGGFWITKVSIPGSQIEGCFQGCATREDDNQARLNVLSLNMYHGFPKFVDFGKRLELIVDEIQRINPDIVFLQEVPWMIGYGNIADEIAKTIGLNHAYARANGNKRAILFEEGEAIFSRYELTDVQAVEIKPKAGFFENRIVLHGVIDSPGGEIDLFNTHLTHGDNDINLEQSSALSVIIADLANHLAIIGDDFNATPNSLQIESLSEKWIETSLWAPTADQQFTCCVNDIKLGDISNLNKRIDYIFLYPLDAVEMLSNIQSHRVFDKPFTYGDGWLWASDHAGLLFDVDMFGR